MGQKKRKTMEKETRPSRFAPLCEGKMQFWQKDTLVNPTKLQSGLFHASKVSLSFPVLKLLDMKLELSKEKLIYSYFVYLAYREQSLLTLLSVFRVGFYAQFHRLCYKTIGSCF